MCIYTYLYTASLYVFNTLFSLLKHYQGMVDNNFYLSYNPWNPERIHIKQFSNNLHEYIHSMQFHI